MVRWDADQPTSPAPISELVSSDPTKPTPNSTHRSDKAPFPLHNKNQTLTLISSRSGCRSQHAGTPNRANRNTQKPSQKLAQISGNQPTMAGTDNQQNPTNRNNKQRIKSTAAMETTRSEHSTIQSNKLNIQKKNEETEGDITIADPGERGGVDRIEFGKP